MSLPMPQAVQGSQWIERIRQGDEAAFEALFRTYEPGLTAFLLRYVDSRAVAEDVVQDVFLWLWKKRTELHIEGSVSTYLFTAAKNRALNHLQKERTGERFRAAALQRAVPFTSAGEDELLELLEVQEVIERLPARCRLVFTLNRQQGLTYTEIAESLGISIKTVETQIGRALKALRAGVLTRVSR